MFLPNNKYFGDKQGGPENIFWLPLSSRESLVYIPTKKSPRTRFRLLPTIHDKYIICHARIIIKLGHHIRRNGSNPGPIAPGCLAESGSLLLAKTKRQKCRAVYWYQYLYFVYILANTILYLLYWFSAPIHVVF